MSNLTDERQKLKKLLSPLNSAPSICAEYKILSELKHLSFFVQICGLKHGRCQYWQRSKLTSIKNHKKLLPPLNSPASICVEYEISSKLKHLPFFVQKYGLKEDSCQHWQVSKVTSVKNYKKLLPPLNSPPLICAEYEISSKFKHLLFFVQS